jgi:hypothetical protein
VVSLSNHERIGLRYIRGLPFTPQQTQGERQTFSEFHLCARFAIHLATHLH